MNNPQTVVPAIEIKSEKYFDLVKSIDPTIRLSYREAQGHFFIFSPLEPGRYTLISPDEMVEKYSDILVGTTVTTRNLVPKED